ncbi:MAG: zeta toxin family protein [Planctomycetota bacterium]|nr:zeta toxin family protein [Planctomycetota bacterium]
MLVLAGVNGAGKSSIGGAAIRAAGADYFNPDEVAARLRALHKDWSQREANAAAWSQGVRLLTRAIERKLDYAFETTLGGRTICGLLARAAASGFRLRVWFVGLSSPEMHLERVRARVAAGGHDIPEEDIRRRFDDSRLHLIQLLPAIHELRVYDNSLTGDPARGHAPRPRLVLHWKAGRIRGPKDLTHTPAWARSIVAAARKLRT